MSQQAGPGTSTPLSKAQHGVWAAQQLDPTTPRYNCGSYLRLDGTVDEDLLQLTIRRVMAQTETLRAVFPDGQLRIADMPEPALDRIDLTAEPDPLAAALDWMRADLARPVDLATGPLVRHTLIRVASESRLLYLRHHHIVLDGFGQTIHWRRIATLYTTLAHGDETPLPPTATFEELLAEEKAYLTSAAAERDRAYWLHQLAERPAPLSLAGATVRPARDVLRYTTELDAAGSAALHEVAARLGTTAPALLIAATAAYVRRATGEPEILLNIPVPVRRSKAARNTPAMFANQLPLRVAPATQDPFTRLVADVTGGLAELLRHQRYRGEDLYRELGLSGSGERLTGLTVNVMVFGDELDFAGTPAVPHFLSAGPVDDVSINFLIEQGGTRVRLVVDANAQRYHPRDLAAHVTHLHTLLRHALVDPDRTVDDLELMESAEIARVLAAGTGPVRPYDLDRCLHDWVTRQAERTPDAIAVSVEQGTLTYRQLVDRASRLARHLGELGAGPGEVIGVHDERGLDLVVQLLAVLMAGAAYLPLDPELPRQRLAFQVADAGVRIILTRATLAAAVTGLGADVVAVDTLPELPAAGALPRPEPADTAYVIYTSGSTGQPKGVAVPHRGVVNRLLWMQEEYGLTPDDRVLQKTPFTFDVSVWEFFWPLMVGARLHLAEPGAHRDPRALSGIIRRHRITTVHFVPTMLDLFLAEPDAADLPTLRRVFASGEALSPETVGRFFSRYGVGAGRPGLHNLYGPTEAAIDVTYWPCTPRDAGGPVPIGRPVANTTVLVLDDRHRPVPVGFPGELYIGGVQVASGYLNRAELTATRFIDNPFGDGRLYRTGDRVVLREDGVLEFLGRLDQQIKIRGFRVELGEVEAALLNHPRVHQAAVTAPRSEAGTRRLVGYVVTAPDTDLAELRAALREQLPEYMVPAQLVPLSEMPRLASGKIDRKALPDPGTPTGAATGTIEPPAGPVEELIHAAYCEVLGLPRVDVHASFFALGGDSILSIRMRTLIERHGFTFAVSDLFQAPAVRQLARRLKPLTDTGTEIGGALPFSLLSEQDRRRLPADVEDAYPLSTLQSGMLFHAGYDETSSVYRVVTSVHIALRLDETRLRQVLAAVLRRHPALRSSFHLTGFSEPLQLVHREVPVPLTVRTDLLDLPAADQEEGLRRWAESAKQHEFELTTAPLLAFTVHPRNADSFQLSVVEHHVVLDGWSDMVMMDEIVARYAAALAGEELWLPEIPSTFRRFIAAEQAALRSAEHRQFWLDELRGAEPTPLPSRSLTGRRHRAAHRRWDVPLPDTVAQRIADAARRAQLPLKSLLTAAHIGVLHLVCAADEVLTGVVSHARLAEEGGDQVIGVFLNTLPLRVHVGQASWLDVARDVHAHEARSAAHRSYPYGQMVRDHPGLNLDSYVNFMDFHEQSAARATVVGGFGIAETDFALAVDFLVDPLGSRLELWLDCDTAVLSEAFCDRLAGYYARALAAIAADPDVPVSAVDLRDEAELALCAAWNQTEVPYPETTVTTLIARQAVATPEAVAIRHLDRQMTYRELDEEVTRLARHLRARGVHRGGRVGVHVRRGIDLVAVLLAVLRAGAAYVPLDPDFPPERLAYISADAALDCVVVDDDDPPPGVHAAALVRLTADRDEIAGQPAGHLADGATPEDPAYVIYTSGSTGNPKGTVVHHRNVVNFFTGMNDRIGLTATDTVLALTSVSFDISVLELLWPLTRGATVVVAGERMIERLLPGSGDLSFVEVCQRYRPTLLQATPSFLTAVAAQPEVLAALRPLTALLVGGEAFPAGLATQLLTGLPTVRVYNMYGPTETTIWSTVHQLDRDCDLQQDVLPIGRPIANTVLRIVAPTGREAPIGVPGELWIGGAGVAGGYLGQAELTAQKFVRPEPDGPVWYRTGDRVRWRTDGVLEFLGRTDRQIKIAGHRIELDEIESVLSRHPEVAAVAVTAQQSGNNTELVAYVAPVAGSVTTQAHESQLEHWRQVWESTYSADDTQDDRTAEEQDFAGWRSSYTQAPIPVPQMREWLSQTARRAAALGARRVVDIGVGVGLFLRELAPQADSYRGVDLSPSALLAAAAKADAGRITDRVTLEQGDALALARMPDSSADLVLFNSVVQYFPSADYLRQALVEAVRVAGPLGAVFLGDIRDLALLDAFHAHVQLHRAGALTPAGEIAAAARRARADEPELCLAADFFTDFAATDAPVSGVRIELKRGVHHNELTRFRYDVTLFGKDRLPPSSPHVVHLAWSALTGLPELADAIRAVPPATQVSVSGIPNRRLVEPFAALRLLAGEHDADVTGWELQRQLWEHEEEGAVDPEEVATLGDALGRRVELRPAGDDREAFDVVFHPTETVAQ